MKMTYTFLFKLMTLLSCISCSQDDCYRLHTNLDSLISQGTPVILDDGVVGFIDQVTHSDTSSVATFCLPSDLRIPKDSKFYVGLIMPFSVYSVKIVSGREEDFIRSEELLYAFSVDSIKLTLPPEDTTLTNKLIDVMKDIDEDRRKKKE